MKWLKTLIHELIFLKYVSLYIFFKSLWIFNFCDICFYMLLFNFVCLFSVSGSNRVINFLPTSFKPIFLKRCIQYHCWWHWHIQAFIPSHLTRSRFQRQKTALRTGGNVTENSDTRIMLTTIVSTMVTTIVTTTTVKLILPQTTLLK